MRPVRRRNNPNKETLIYIPSSHVTVIRVYSTWITKQHNELVISTLLLLLLVLPIYLSRCPSVSTHIHPYMSKLRLLLETNDETNESCLQWVFYIPGTTTQDVPVLTQNLALGKQKVGLILWPFRNITRGRESALLSDTWRPLGRSESWSCITYLIPL